MAAASVPEGCVMPGVSPLILADEMLRLELLGLHVHGVSLFWLGVLLVLVLSCLVLHGDLVPLV